MPQQPNSPSLRSSAAGYSSSRITGRTSVSMNCRTVSRIRRWSSLREKSIARDVKTMLAQWQRNAKRQRESLGSIRGEGLKEEGVVARLHLQQLAQPFCLRAADGNLRLLFIRHFEHVAGLEPRHHFLDAVDVDQVRSVRAPKDVGIERGLQLLDGAVV